MAVCLFLYWPNPVSMWLPFVPAGGLLLLFAALSVAGVPPPFVDGPGAFFLGESQPFTWFMLSPYCSGSCLSDRGSDRARANHSSPCGSLRLAHLTQHPREQSRLATSMPSLSLAPWVLRLHQQQSQSGEFVLINTLSATYVKGCSTSLSLCVASPLCFPLSH